MKHFILLVTLLCSLQLIKAQSLTDSVTMGSGYSSQVYYQLSSQAKYTIPYSAWDIGFITSLMSGAVISNPNTITVYRVPNLDSTEYTSLTDTAGISNWRILYNSDTSWYTGAFNSTANVTNPFDFGWGIYDFNAHIVYGDSLFMVKKDTSFIKLWIKEKTGTGTYIMRYTYLDGTFDSTVTIDPYSNTDQNFILYNLQTTVTVSEPPSADWDILFNHYITTIPGLGPYPVTGVQSNIGVTVAKANKVDVNTVSYTGYLNDFLNNLSAIGYDWKTFDPTTFTYTIEDSLVYFVQTRDGKIYSLRFTGFNSATGTSIFEVMFDAEVGIHEVNKTLESAMIYPNPANDQFTLAYSAKKRGTARVTILDLEGKEVAATSFDMNEGLNVQQIASASLSDGIYFVKINSLGDELKLKLILSKK
ncbi:MAG: T9SS type A sorting domain-containing protein [Chitinophagales bacterium]|nr:T9SS type A sorting domain-containing protein [Chitinophagales bacterium]